MFPFTIRYPVLSFSFHSTIFLSLYTCAFLPFNFVFWPLPPCSEISLLQLRVGKENFLFNSSFLRLERASRVYLGILGNKILVSEQGRFSPPCVFKTARTGGRGVSRGHHASEDSEYSASSPVSRSSRPATPSS